MGCVPSNSHPSSPSRCYFRKGVLGNRSNSSKQPISKCTDEEVEDFIYGMHLIWLSPPPDIKLRFVIGCPTVDTIVVLLLSPRVIVRVMTHLNNISTLLLHVLIGDTCQAEGDEGGINLPPNTDTRPHRRSLGTLFFALKNHRPSTQSNQAVSFMMNFSRWS